MNIVLAILLGGAFGAVLDRIGATNPNLIWKMLNLRNLHLMKTILLGIGVGSVLMFGGQMFGIVDVGHMSVKTAHVGVVLGGLLLGAGWGLSGYCPGTGVVAAASGRRDAMVYVLGGLAGTAAYMVLYPAIASTGLLGPIAGGQVTLGRVPGAAYEGLTSLRGDFLGIGLGGLFILVAYLLPARAIEPPGRREGSEGL